MLILGVQWSLKSLVAPLYATDVPFSKLFFLIFFSLSNPSKLGAIIKSFVSWLVSSEGSLTLFGLGEGWGGGGGGVPAPISTFKNFLDIYTVPIKCGHFSGKKFTSSISHVVMATPFLTTCLLNF